MTCQYHTNKATDRIDRRRASCGRVSGNAETTGGCPCARNVRHAGTSCRFPDSNVTKFFNYSQGVITFIASDFSAWRVATERESPGIYANPSSFDDIVSAALKVAADRELRRQRCELGQHYAETEFGWEQTSEPFLSLNVIRILIGAVLLLANIIVAVILAPLLALSLLGSITLLTLLFGNRLRLVQEQGGKVSRIQTDVLRVIENYANNLRTAKMAGAVGKMQNEFGMKIDELGAEIYGFAMATELTKMALQVIAAIAVAVALLVAVHGFGASGPVLLLLVFITARFIPRLTVLSQNAHSVFYDLPAFQHAYDVLQECRAHRDLSQESGARLIAKNSIGLRDIRIVSDDGTGKPIHDDVSLQIATGEFVAIIGPSGAGKSTLADVLSGLLRPDSGELLIDDIPLDDRCVLDWRHTVGYVPQAAALLQDTIEHNLNWVLPEPATELELERALRCAQISHLASELQEGLGTIIDRREGTLSGGERQRLAIARELLRQPQLLILDEATSALDVDNEALVLDNIRRYYATVTVLVITHRSTAIDRADRIVHIVDGKTELSRDRVATSC